MGQKKSAGFALRRSGVIAIALALAFAFLLVGRAAEERAVNRV
jgi:hypothetical protein